MSAEIWTLEQVEAHYKSMGLTPPLLSGSPEVASVRATASQVKLPKVQPIDGPVSETIVLWGHCPSKKNLWERRQAGRMVLPPEVKQQIEVITQQALFAWKHSGPVEHPDLTFRFFVNAARRDRDGMFTTVLDCLQSAGILGNDNLAHNNGRTVLEPVCFVAPADERVEILIEKM